MNSIIGGIVRTGIAAFGGWLVSKGLATSDDAATLASNTDAVVGVATVLGTAAWSWWSKRSSKAVTK